MAEFIDEELLAQIEQAVAKDGVWVSPTLPFTVTAAQEKQLEQAVKDFDGTAFVVLIDLDYDDQLTHGDFRQLTALIHEDAQTNGTRADGVYFGVEALRETGPQVDISVMPGSWSEYYQAARIAKIHQPDDVTAQVIAAMDAITAGDLDAQLDALQASDPDSYDHYFGVGSGQSDDSGGMPAGPIIGGVLAVVVAAVAVALLRRRRAIAPTSRVREFTVPKAVLANVREAEDTRMEASTLAAVQALGERLTDHEVTDKSSTRLTAWQEALDHYEVARRILSRDHSPADTVGAAVLTRRGQSALDTALSSGRKPKAWKPPATCYFNPLHNGPMTSVGWSGRWGTITVPACRACAASVANGTEPRDVLDFVEQGLPQHYFNLDLGVWSRTGYGAVEPDLLGALVSG